MSTVNESIEPDDYTDPHPAVVTSDEDSALAEALRRLLDNKSCPGYIKDVGQAWLARLEA